MRHIWLLRGLILATALLGGGYFFMVLFQCGPTPSIFWEDTPRTAPGDKCWSDKVVLGLTYAASAVNCLADWAFGLMPVLVVRTLNMPRGARILVACLMSFAAVYVYPFPLVFLVFLLLLLLLLVSYALARESLGGDTQRLLG